MRGLTYLLSKLAVNIAPKCYDLFYQWCIFYFCVFFLCYCWYCKWYRGYFLLYLTGNEILNVNHFEQKALAFGVVQEWHVNIKKSDCSSLCTFQHFMYKTCLNNYNKLFICQSKSSSMSLMQRCRCEKESILSEV